MHDRPRYTEQCTGVVHILDDFGTIPTDLGTFAGNLSKVSDDSGTTCGDSIPGMREEQQDLLQAHVHRRLHSDALKQKCAAARHISLTFQQCLQVGLGLTGLGFWAVRFCSPACHEGISHNHSMNSNQNTG